MKLEQKLTAPQLAALSLAGSLLLYASFCLALRLPSHRPTGCECPSFGEVVWSARFYFLSWIMSLVIGACAMYGGLAAFKRGVGDDLWDQVSRDKLLQKLKCPLWTRIATMLAVPGIAFILFTVFVLSLGFNSPLHKYAGMVGMSYFAIAPLYALGCLRRDLKPQRDPLTRAPIWNQIQPIQSDHWGERNA